jgi:hypothetical protein
VELKVMKKLFKPLILLSLTATAIAGCVVAPVGYYPRGYYSRGYYGPRVAVIAPAPVVVVRP